MNLFHLPPALRNRRFTTFWVGLVVSNIGSQMQVTALLWHLRLLNNNPIAVSGIGIARFIPILLFAPIGGLMADTHDRRKIIFITQSTMTLVATCLGILTISGVIQLWHIYLLTGIQATALAFDIPARQSMPPNLVSKKDLTSALSIQSVGFNTGSIIGPALSGLVIAYLGMQYVYFINAISFFAVIIALIAIGPVKQKLHKVNRGIRQSFAAILDGVRFVIHQPIIFSSMILDFFASFFSSANTLMPFVARDILHLDEVGYGWLSAAQSIGAVIMGFFISQRTNLKRQGLLLLWAVFLFGMFTAVFGLTRSFPAAFLALIVVGAGDDVSTILRNTIRQIHTPDHVRGRTVSMTFIFFQGGPQLGEIEAGLVAQAFGIPAAIISGGLGCILVVALVALRVPQLRNYDGFEPQSTAGN
jgi:MFS family permease